MLFVSRMLVTGKYGVVDTDDDVEEFVSADYLKSLVTQDGLKIRGVQVDTNTNAVVSITPYQVESKRTKLQTKTRVMLGVDVVSYKDEVAAIIVRNKLKKDGVRIRPSQYGKRMCWNVPIWWMISSFPNQLVLVMDDNIEMVGDFAKFGNPGVRLDLREVTNEALLDQVYGYLTGSVLWNMDWSNYIEDYEERTAMWRSSVQNMEE